MNPRVQRKMSEPKTGKKTASTAEDWGSRSHIQTLLLIAVTVVGIYFCYRLAAPFIPAFAWALALAILFAPLYRWIESKVKHPNLAATLCVLLAGLIVVIPAIFVADQMIGEASAGAESIRKIVDAGQWRRSLDAHPLIAAVVSWIDQQFDLQEIVDTAASWLTGTAASFVNSSVLNLIGIVLTFYFFFYFLRDRNALLDSLRSLSPLSEKDMDRMFDGARDTVHATLYGTFAVAVVQGTLGGLMFWWLDLPAPLLWGTVMAALAVVPVLGAFIVWIPAAIFLFLNGSEGKALLLTVWGAIVVGGIDNLLYPILVGTRLKMHTVLAFVALVGGLIVFGTSGLILGPVLFTVTKILLEIWRRQNKQRTPAARAGPPMPVRE